jgi:hypothetical protein
MDRAALRPAPAAGIRFPEFHPQVFKANDVALFIAEDLRWGSQKDEFDAFMFGRDDFHFIGRHLFAGAAVDDRYFSNGQADQGAHAVDGGIAADGIGEKNAVHSDNNPIKTQSLFLFIHPPRRLKSLCVYLLIFLLTKAKQTVNRIYSLIFLQPKESDGYLRFHGAGL